MRKLLVATHGRFAEGIGETLRFILGDFPAIGNTECVYGAGF